MVNNSDVLKQLQETSARHEQTLVALQTTSASNAQALQDVLRQLTGISEQLGQSSQHTVAPEGASGTKTSRGKDRMRPEGEDGFPFPPKPVAVELPLFTGQDPEEWIASAQDFFEFYGTEDHHRVTMASFRMDGIAKRWYRWMQRRRQLAGWDHLVDAIRKRFSITEIESPEGQLTKLCQTTTVGEYQSRFEELSLRTANLPKVFLIQCFISGLRSDIKHEVLASRVSTMAEVLAMARFHESRLTDAKRAFSRTSGPKFQAGFPSPNSPPQGPRSLPGQPPPVLHTTSPLHPRKISSAEMQLRRDKGLCFYCDEKFTPGHKCKTPQLFLLDDGGKDTIPPAETDGDIDHEESTEQPWVSFNTLAGCYTPNTWRVTGRVQGQDVRILIDGGSTHNFIQTRVANHLGLKLTAAPNFRVLVGNGAKLHSDGWVNNLQV
ncbi:hypothetical protein HRI_003956800 [Hibiscus trionum]|uniref:Retrotransposon gag domain-containing protein n=1 Tax=Hibiscus trionum TaxID=183268 RepID=A0A9W7MMK2_HIBTR|nr:hypothetical protein HRI_003956800 [Hibiscus trionum]